MKLLLDTHIWLWSVLDPDRLSPRVARALRRKENELWLSPLSIWELLVLVEKGRVALNSGVTEWVAEALKKAPLREAPFTQEVALETGQVHLAHRDPVDRFLVATARVFALTLVTADKQLVSGKQVSVLSNP